MFKSRKSLMLGVIAALAPLASVANAQDNGLGYALLFGYGANNAFGIRPFIPAPPYFALHPPVYYGQRYTRPYGDSPFAAFPQLRSPAGYEPRPAASYAQPVVINFGSAHPQAGSSYQPAPVVPMQAEPFHAAPTEAVPPPAPAAPAAPAAPVKPSPVVIQARPIQPLVIDNPYYPADNSRFVRRSIGR